MEYQIFSFFYVFLVFLLLLGFLVFLEFYKLKNLTGYETFVEYKILNGLCKVLVD